MSFGTTAVMLVLIVMVARVLRARYDAQGRGIRNFTPTDDTRHLREEVHTLKERIAVLERLATDENNATRLDREIEKLRDRT
ncbi:MAG: hypothetical protein WC803_03800 [Sphingomonas sp.]|jgi:uncharacterized protein YlxW (UPF0749 family)